MLRYSEEGRDDPQGFTPKVSCTVLRAFSKMPMQPRPGCEPAAKVEYEVEEGPRGPQATRRQRRHFGLVSSLAAGAVLRTLVWVFILSPLASPALVVAIEPKGDTQALARARRSPRSNHSGFCQTETCSRLSPVNGSLFQPLQRSRRLISYLAAQYQRLRPRRGHKKALGAVKHSIICVCWHMLTTGELYRDLGGDYFQRRDPVKTTKRLIAQLEALGHHVILEPLAA